MSMLKFFSRPRFSSRQVDIALDHERAALLAADPLSHPDLAHMSMNELADLPLMPENLGRLAAAARQPEGCLHRR